MNFNIKSLLKSLIALGVYPPKSGGGGGIAGGWSAPEIINVPAGTEFLVEGIPPEANEVFLGLDYTRPSSGNIGPDIQAIVDNVVSPDNNNFAFAFAKITLAAHSMTGGGTSNAFTPGGETGTAVVGEVRLTRIANNKWAIAAQTGSNGFWVGCGAGVARLSGNLTGFRFASRFGADFLGGSVIMRYRT